MASGACIDNRNSKQYKTQAFLEGSWHGPHSHLIIEHVLRKFPGNGGGKEEQCTKLDLALEREVHVAVRSVVRLESRLVELLVLSILNLLGWAHPERLGHVDLLPHVGGLGDRLCLRLLTLLHLCVRVRHRLVLGLLGPQLNRKGDELGVALEHLAQSIVL
eukprot:scaffold145130_cov31-Tisochrysis_lutea.AAC.4